MCLHFDIGGYGGVGIEDAVMVDGFDEALVFAINNDNAGNISPNFFFVDPHYMRTAKILTWLLLKVLSWRGRCYSSWQK